MNRQDWQKCFATRNGQFLHFLIPTILENSNIPILLIASLALMNPIWFLL
ncbi:hypothetical protein CsSME_00009963 [Camellia sinensis var. sinensis]